MTVTLAYVAELFPTAVRATLSAVVIACQVAAGSLGLALLGSLTGVVNSSLVMLILGSALLASIVLLRGLPETRGRNLIHEGEPLPAAREPAVTTSQPLEIVPQT